MEVEVEEEGRTLDRRSWVWERRERRAQQQPPDAGFTGVLEIFTLDFSEPPEVAPGPILFLISAAMVMKACSTLVAFLALVSKNGMPRESANSWVEQNAQCHLAGTTLLDLQVNKMR